MAHGTSKINALLVLVSHFSSLRFAEAAKIDDRILGCNQYTSFIDNLRSILIIIMDDEQTFIVYGKIIGLANNSFSHNIRNAEAELQGCDSCIWPA